MINILFISFQFPPLVAGGVYRPLAFVQHLPEQGINPIVFTLDRSTYDHVYDAYNIDEELGRGIFSSRTVIEVPANKPAKQSRFEKFSSIYFSVLGNEMNEWKDNFYQAVDKAVGLYLPKAVFVTVPPFSALGLAQKIASKYDLPLITDFRDAFSQWRGTPYGSYGHYLTTLHLEKKYLKSADAIITTSRQTLADFRGLHPKIPAALFHYIPNGYSGELGSWRCIDPEKNEIVIGYVGSFYYSPSSREEMFRPWWKKRGHRMLQYIPSKQDWLYRSPYYFFKALKQLNELYPALGQRIKVKFAGKKPEWMEEMVRSFGLQDQVTLVGELTHKRSLEFQLDCDLLLITSAKQIGGRDYSIAGKTFEYFQMHRPILAFVCEGAQKDLLEESGTALICDPDDTEESVDKMKDILNGNIDLTPNYPFLQKLTRKELTADLAKLIVKTIDSHEMKR